MRVHVQGDGLASRCCQRLLQDAGAGISVQHTQRRPVPALLLADAALHLIRDVFQDHSLFQSAPTITNRVVAWRPGMEPVTLPHHAVTLSEAGLLQTIHPDVSLSPQPSLPDWTIYCSRPLPSEMEAHAFGTRTAAAFSASLRQAPIEASCWVESVASGWLFLIQMPPTAASLLCVGAAPDSLLSESSVIASEIDQYAPVAAGFPAYPQIALPLAGTDWLACGTAAMAFDPLCGDGTAYAVRESILAAAVLNAIDAGGDAAALTNHYQARSLAGFGRHLQLCWEFYRTGNKGPWWDAQMAEIERGIRWCAAQQASLDFSRYRLNGLKLEPVR